MSLSIDLQTDVSAEGRALFLMLLKKIHIKKWASFQSKHKELWYPFLFDLSVVLRFVFSIQ